MMKNNETSSNILTAIVVLAVLAVIFGTVQGRKQDAVWVNEYQTYQSAIGNASKNIDQSISTLQDLLKNDNLKNSASLNWQLGKMLRYKQEYAVADQYYERVKQIYPAVVQDHSYQAEYGDVLVHLQKFSEAKKYVEQVLTNASASEQEREWATETLNYIKNQNA
jgi:tetratricopeptide (TPR) repeat protein